MQPEATDSREIFMQLVTKSSEALQKLEMKKQDPGRVSSQYLQQRPAFYLWVSMQCNMFY